MRYLLVVAVVASTTFLAPTTAAATKVPVEIASGPSFFNLDRPQIGGEPGVLAADQPWHFGWRLEVAAVIDRQWAREHPDYVPPEHRQRLRRVKEVRFSPAFLSFIPRSLFISPKFWNTGIYGATWELLHGGVGASIGRARLNVGAGLVATYAFIHSDTIPSPTHFLRPGFDLGAYLFIPFTDETGVSIGWDSQMYIPQHIGAGIFQIGRAGENLWHIGEAFVSFHYTFPYRIP